VSILRKAGIRPVFKPDSNSPQVRLAAIERMASQMRKRSADRSEAFIINSDPERWLVISEKATACDRFLADAFEAGYVWDEHMVSVGNKQVRKPKKDGWFEHGMNTSEYLELNFGQEFKAPKPKPQSSQQSYPAQGPMSWAV
jgi:hypothetical protein